jgi:hypothetical protein
MILDSTLRLEAVLAGAVATNQPNVHTHFIDYNPAGEKSRPVTSRNLLNSTTDVIIAAAPRADVIRELERVSVYNRDTASVTVLIKTDNGTTEHPIIRTVLTTLQTLHFEKGTGWYVT